MQNTRYRHTLMTTYQSLRLARLVKPTSTSDEAGLTLIECVMAIVVVGLMGAAIAPMMVASVATRVQSQKAEQALELAQGEIDRVRIQFEQNNLDSSLPVEVAVVGNRAPDVAGPSSLTDAATTLRQVDVDNDGAPDFVIQSYLVEKAGVDDTYEMGVRVYDYNTVDNTSGALATDEARLGFTDSQGERAEKPISVLYTNVGITEDGESLCNWIDYTDPDGTATKPATCN